MKIRPNYKVKIIDESRLVEKGAFSLTRTRVVLTMLCGMLVFIGIGIGIVCLTPVKKLLPGYMKPDQRVRTEEAFMKVDSLQQLYRVQQAYLDNLVKVLDTDRQPDLPDTARAALPLIPDSLMVSSEIEREFMKKMEEAGYVITINQDYEESQE